MDYDKRMGRECESLVQRTLWKYGYSVKMGTGRGADLFINNGNKSYEVEVKSCNFNKGFKFQFSRNQLPLGKGENELTSADVYAFVFIYPDKTMKVRYLPKVVMKALVSKRTGIMVPVIFHNPDAPILIKSPFGVFGKPLKTKKEKN